MLWSFLYNFCSIYLNNILIYSKNRKKHNTYVKKLLKRFRVANFQIVINKCEFFAIEMKYLKWFISIKKIKINSAKIKIIIKWNRSINFKHAKWLINFCNFIHVLENHLSKLSSFWTFSSKKILYSFETIFVM